MYSITQKPKTGFTLIEMLVSVGLFAVTVTMSMGSLLILVDAHSRSQSVQVAVDNLSFALDSITRQLRTGQNYYCAPNINALTTGAPPGVLRGGERNCSNGGQAISFTDTRTGWRYGFALNGNTIQRKVDKPGDIGEWENMTGANLRVTQARFVLDGTGNTTVQPAVTINIQIEVGDVVGLGTSLDMQTSIVQRSLNL